MYFIIFAVQSTYCVNPTTQITNIFNIVLLVFSRIKSFEMKSKL